MRSWCERAKGRRDLRAHPSVRTSRVLPEPEIQQMLTEKLQIDTEMEMLARGTSASLSVGDDRRVVQRVKLCVCERKIKRGHLTACREKHM